MTSTQEAATKILEGFKQSNGTFNRDQSHDERTTKRHGELAGTDLDHANVISQAVSQLVAAVGTEIEYSAIVNAPTGAPGNPFDYHCAVFSRGLLGYIEFTTGGTDPQLLVRTVPRSSITEIEVRAAKDYRSEQGSLVFIVKYASGLVLDIRERDSEGHNVSTPGPWLQELFDALREDLAAA